MPPLPLVQNSIFPRPDVYRFGDGNHAQPLFRDLNWIAKEGESWAVIGSGGREKKTALHSLGRYRIAPYPPPPGGIFPFLTLAGLDPYSEVSIVSFGHRQQAGGAFYDYSARYGAVHEEDRLTLRQSMFPETIPPLRMPYEDPTVEESARFNELVAQMGLGQFLDLPLIALSNGQTRRARILKAVLKKPKLLRNPRVIIGLRGQDALPDWVDHVLYVKGSMVTAGERESVLREVELGLGGQALLPKIAVLIDLKNVKLSWQIRQGERWHLVGENGSGKTTLLSLITDSSSSDSPRETSSHLQLFSQPRSRLPTTLLRSAIAILSPDIFDAFPRRSNMTVWDVIGTGFDGDFVPKGQDGWKEEEGWRMARVWEVLEALGPEAWKRANAGESAITAPSPASSPSSNLTHQFAQTSFPSLPLPQQRIVLLMRALVGRPPLILLDEVWSGMDETMVRVAREYLRGVGPDQAVVVITHWEEEVPWNRDEDAGVFRKFRLSGGKGWVEE
ncbi:P-loop containing nucleoside triphosphate hydrolase protein [Gymnopus androsaceus JB14]|uniref:P-loop containing nucleoside triphosphate hydrolase protein n=1 Tax=Gymnopus androsaceus JB14 TaxID=1447944 RepID=A0A6A4GS05_9AGAR|nr:P-loop containing nucleoside triphosphate hydrolase protein [Gymnopus androsaceus JB14]